MRLHHAAAAAISLALLAPLPSATAGTGYLSDPAEFTLKWGAVDQHGITLHIDTSLPDNAEVRLRLFRTYEATSEGKSQTYSQDYLKEESTVAEWRQPRRILIDDDVWAAELQADQDKWVRLGMPFEVDSIDTHIEATAYTYAHKTGERFGFREYPSLSAKIKDIETVGESEIRALRPMTNSAAIPNRSMIVGSDDLESGQAYRLIEDSTPLMPIAGTAATIKDLPAGTMFLVKQRGLVKGRMWYHVVRLDNFNEGLINSLALRSHGVYLVSDPGPIAEALAETLVEQ